MKHINHGGRWHPIRILLNNIRWGLMDAKFRGGNLLRGGSIPYTVVRPGGLTNDPPGQRELVVGVHATCICGKHHCWDWYSAAAKCQVVMLTAAGSDA